MQETYTQEKPSENLYDRLEETDSLNENLGKTVKEANQNLEQFKGMQGYKDVSTPDSKVPTIDIESVQKGIFCEYKGNSILQNALSGCKSIEQTVDELSQINKGIKRFLPHRKNKEHNQKCDELSDLMPERYHLRTNGLLALDNFVNNTVLWSAVSFALCRGMELSFSFESNTMPDQILSTYAPIAMSILMMIAGMNHNRYRKEGIAKTKEYARYLDHKIEALYSVEARHPTE